MNNPTCSNCGGPVIDAIFKVYCKNECDLKQPSNKVLRGYAVIRDGYGAGPRRAWVYKSIENARIDKHKYIRPEIYSIWEVLAPLTGAYSKYTPDIFCCDDVSFIRKVE